MHVRQGVYEEKWWILPEIILHMRVDRRTAMETNYVKLINIDDYEPTPTPLKLTGAGG